MDVISFHRFYPPTSREPVATITIGRGVKVTSSQCTNVHHARKLVESAMLRYPNAIIIWEIDGYWSFRNVFRASEYAAHRIEMAGQVGIANGEFSYH